MFASVLFDFALRERLVVLEVSQTKLIQTLLTSDRPDYFIDKLYSWNI